MKLWHPDPLGRRGRSDIIEFADWYSSPFRNPLEWNLELAFQRSVRAYGTWFALGYAEAYLSGAPVSARYLSGLRGVRAGASWKFLLPRIAIPLTVASIGIYLVSKIPPDTGTLKQTIAHRGGHAPYPYLPK